MKVQNYRDVTGESVANARGTVLRKVVSEQDGAPNFIMRVLEVRPGGSTPHDNHPWEHEVFVLRGQGVVVQESVEHPLREGSVVFVPGGEDHQFRNTGSETLEFICVIPRLDK